MSGKGDKRRPSQVSKEIADLRWDLAFGTDEQREDAKARLAFLEWEEFQKNNPQLWGDKNDKKTFRNS